MKKIYLALFLPVCLLMSCGDFLEPSSQDQYTASSVSHLEEMIVNALTPANGFRLTGALDLMSDDVMVYPEIFPYTEGSHAWYTRGGRYSAVAAWHTWQPDYYTKLTDAGSSAIDYYSNSQTRLIYANAILDNVDKVSGTENEKRWVEAQAKALRAFYYLYLVNIYGQPYTAGEDGIGIPIRTTAAYDEERIVRSTVGEVYDLITSDLERALEIFDELQPSAIWKQHRPTQPMVLLLLARTYLYMGNWERAAFYADRLINEWSEKFSMLDMKTSTFNNCSNETGTTNAALTVKLRQRFYTFMSYTNPDVIWMFGGTSDIYELALFTLELPNDRKVNQMAPGYYVASQDLIDKFEANDLRRRYYLVREVFSEQKYTDVSETVTPVYFKPYGKTHITGGNIPTVNFIPLSGATYQGQALRMTEAYMIRAEANAMLFKEQSNADAQKTAIDDLNDIRIRRFLAANYTAYTAGSFANADELVEAVRDERRREFCFEALRWFDLRRWGMPEIKHVLYNTASGAKETYTLNQNDPGYTVPMPENVLDQNLDMTQVPVYSASGRPYTSVE